MPIFQQQQQLGSYQRRRPAQQFGAQPAGGQPMYQRGMGQQAPQAAPAAPLQAQGPLTEAGQLSQDRTTQGLKTGQFAEVQSAQAATDRAGALRQYQALQTARGGAVRGNLSMEQAQRAQDESLAAANAQNLTAQNSVNALQRQYGQDAQNRGDIIERDARANATNERDFQTGRMDLGYDRNQDASRYADTRGDVNYQRGYQENRDQIGDKRYDQSYAATRGDTLDARNFRDLSYGDSRSDVNYQRGRDTVGDQRYAQEYSDKRGDVNYDRTYQAGRDTVGDQRYDQTYQDSRGDVAYQRGRDTVGDARYADETAYTRGRDTVGDQRYADSTAYSRGRDTVGDARYADETQYTRGRDTTADNRYNQTYADSRGDVNYNRDESKRLEGKGDVESLISSVQDPKAQNILRSTLASGGDVKAMYNTMMDNGTIKEGFHSDSPGTAAFKASADELKAMYPDKSDTEIRDMVKTNYETAQAPANQAAKTRAQEDAYGRLATGKPQEGDYDQLDSITPQTLPRGSNVAKWLSESKSGGWTKIGNTPYKVVKGARRVSVVGDQFHDDRHEDYTVLQDQNGKTMYLRADGNISAKKPKDASGY